MPVGQYSSGTVTVQLPDPLYVPGVTATHTFDSGVSRPLASTPHTNRLTAIPDGILPPLFATVPCMPQIGGFSPGENLLTGGHPKISTCASAVPSDSVRYCADTPKFQILKAPAVPAN